ncbi:metallophosphoesterase [bacterium]|nr:metallophosphoesterase [bacterium]
MKNLFYRLLLTSLLFSGILIAGNSNTFSFVQICDTQLGFGKSYRHDVEAFKQSVEKINELNPDFVVICGDLVNSPGDQSFSDFKEINSKFIVPSYLVSGNHDVGNNPTKDSLNRYRKIIGKDYYSFKNKGITFVVVNSQLWKSPVKDETEKQDLWLKKTLASSKNEKSPVVILQHYPVFLEKPDETNQYYNLPLKTRGKLLDLFADNGVIAVLGGHVHRKIANEYKGIKFVNGETISKNFDGRPLGFRVWEYETSEKNDKQDACPTLNHKFVPLDVKKIEKKLVARDLFSDTWVATDAIGRKLPGYDNCGATKSNKFVGIFYWTWHHLRHQGPFDVTKIVAEAKKTGKLPKWGPWYSGHHWGEPELGYYVNTDPYVNRKHASMLVDAGVDVLFFDTSNPPFTFRDEYMTLCKTYEKIRSEGGKTPQIAFLTPFGDPSAVVNELATNFYGKGLYKDLWFIWQGKPLILANPTYFKDNPVISNFFTFRWCLGSYFTKPWESNQWSWLNAYPQHVFYNDKGEAEQMSVGVAHNAMDNDLACMSCKKGAMGRTWHKNKKDTRKNAVNYGFNFQEQWNRAHKINPNFIFITGWNEWIAGRFDKFHIYTAEKDSYYTNGIFVDQYNQEYSRDVEPMKGGHTDTYYYQLVDNIRRYKGVRKPAKAILAKSILIDGKFEEWKDVQPEFRDTLGDTTHRDFRGYGKTHYTNKTGRNDIIASKVSYDESNIYFYVTTRDPLTPHTDKNWMMLFIDIDQNKKTGWEGYDFIVNENVLNSGTTTIKRAKEGWNWKKVSNADYKYSGNEFEVKIPRKVLDLTNTEIAFDFHWADNIQKENDIIEFSISGDSAPNRRFNYRYELK